MRLIIIGAVAEGTSAAAKARRNDEKSEIVIYEKDSFISYSSCAMPYYIGGVVENVDELIPRDPTFFKSKYNVDIDTHKPKSAVIVGTGFIGLEVCENLVGLGIQVTLLEKLPQVTPGLDNDISVYVKEHIEKTVLLF